MSSSAVASKWLRFIFQLPLMSGRRPVEVGRQALGAPRRASSPGRSPSSSSSSDAPPPVETWSTSFCSPNWASAAARVAAADHREAAGLGHGLGHRAGAGREARVLEHAHRAVPEDGAGLGDEVEELGRGARPDVEAHPPVGQVHAHLAHLAPGVGIADLAARAERGDVVGDGDRRARVEQPAARLDLVGLEQAGRPPGGPGRPGT